MRRSVALALASLVAFAATNLGSQALAHDAVNFGAPLYRIAEDDGSATVLIERGTHGQGPASVQMVASEDSATAPDDFTAVTRTIGFSTPVEEAEAFIPIADDSVQEEVEIVDLSLQEPTGGMVVAFPHQAELSIIDDDGPSRVSPERQSYAAFESRGAVEIWVLRSGSDLAPAAVDYATVDGTAKAGSDYLAKSGTLEFAGGERAKRVAVAIVDDSVTEGDLTFGLTLSNASGAEIASSSTEVLIRDDEGSVPADQIAPYTAFHQPLHKKKYRQGALKEFLVFMQDDAEGSGMAKVQIALRKKLTSGKCAWWTGERFRRRACSTVRWSKEKGDYFTDLALFSIGRLKPSTKAKEIRFYTAYSRGTDNVGNVQTLLDKGQNRNDFEIRR